MKTSIVIRARNDMPVIKRTLAGLQQQNTEFEIFAFDNGSTDGTREELAKVANKIIDVKKYIPGLVLNQGMTEANSDKVVFLNSDCVPMHKDWLKNLVNSFPDENCAAVFGRQIPRKDCQAIFFKDTEDTFGDGERQKYWKHCFSMASSAISRKIWQQHPFREDIQYSEDIDWTWRMRQHGFSIKYVADSVVEHSHNYTPAQFYRRQYGEGKAEATIFTWNEWEQNWLRYSFLPFLRQLFSDFKYAFKFHRPKIIFESPVYRLAQMLGRRKGFIEGLEQGKCP